MLELVNFGGTLSHYVNYNAGELRISSLRSPHSIEKSIPVCFHSRIFDVLNNLNTFRPEAINTCFEYIYFPSIKRAQKIFRDTKNLEETSVSNFFDCDGLFKQMISFWQMTSIINQLFSDVIEFQLKIKPTVLEFQRIRRMFPSIIFNFPRNNFAFCKYWFAPTAYARTEHFERFPNNKKFQFTPIWNSLIPLWEAFAHNFQLRFMPVDEKFNQFSMTSCERKSREKSSPGLLFLLLSVVCPVASIVSVGVIEAVFLSLTNTITENIWRNESFSKWRH